MVIAEAVVSYARGRWGKDKILLINQINGKPLHAYDCIRKMLIEQPSFEERITQDGVQNSALY